MIIIKEPQTILTITNIQPILTITNVGIQGTNGTNGQGVPIGGTINQILAKNSNSDYDTEWIDKDIVITEHSDLTGLSDDDHTQYHNNTRGDIRYNTKSQMDIILQELEFQSILNALTLGG